MGVRKYICVYLVCVSNVYVFALQAKMNLSFKHVIFIPVYVCTFRLVLVLASALLYFTALLCSWG